MPTGTTSTATGGGSDIYSACLTVSDYLALSPWRRFLYRLPRHPLIANVLLPPLVFLLLYRVPFDTPRAWRRERWSVYLTNAALVCLFGSLVAFLGWREVLLVHLPIMVVASILGVWLFSLQHRFETARWTAKSEWSFVDGRARRLVVVPPAARAALAHRQHRLPPRPSPQSARPQLPAARGP